MKRLLSFLSVALVAALSAQGFPEPNQVFVKTSGTRFTLNGEIFTPVGGNSYWVGLTELSTSDMHKAFADIAGAGGTVVRTWGFNDVISPGSGDFYQSWSGSTPTINTGPTGLENFDNVVAAAKANNIRLLVALTNNWNNYGGMDVYVNSIIGQGQPHDFFYTDPRVMSAYKNYVKTFVERYEHEPTIMAWELANEPRCAGSTGVTSGKCTTATITKWASTMSAYIKSIDSNHLVAMGDEGFFNDPSSPLYPYQGGEGIDFDANMKIKTLDFGTFHLYPESWGQTTANSTGFGVEWITDHAAVMKSQNKPAIMEEFGILDIKSTAYPAWYSTILSSGLTGDLIWQAGSNLTNGLTANDGYAIYPWDPIYALEISHAAALKARDRKEH
jgi:mannan endo-1,4-beta-mannosidase